MFRLVNYRSTVMYIEYQNMLLVVYIDSVLVFSEQYTIIMCLRFGI